MKRIYFKENFVGTAKEPFCWEIFWKRHRWMPFRKLDGTYNFTKKRSLLLTYAENYDVRVWDEILNEYVSVSEYLNE